MQPLATELAFEALVSIGTPLDMGQTATGKRRVIPITGRTFEGPKISGDVLAGGADWQTVRADGCAVVEAIYALEASDGAVIAVRNLGLVAPLGGGAPYVRTAPSFDAPAGPHDWLNRNIFVGTIGRVEGGGAVRITVYRVI
ncbi:DUF3237 family protein [Phenylobacterium sp.]|uniref:DUF3237 family protein n=1 Tax=Phenylobacterium sp. TaxID=1871053 RepID=UPI002869FC6C|nr:DUF3237 family protein [Phenylobacterium sp.]